MARQPVLSAVLTRWLCHGAVSCCPHPLHTVWHVEWHGDILPGSLDMEWCVCDDSSGRLQCASSGNWPDGDLWLNLSACSLVSPSPPLCLKQTLTSLHYSDQTTRWQHLPLFQIRCCRLQKYFFSRYYGMYSYFISTVRTTVSENDNQVQSWGL